MRTGLFASLAVLVLVACSTTHSQAKKDTVEEPPPKETSAATPSPSSRTPDEEGQMQGDHLTGGPALHGMEGHPQAGFAADASSNLKEGEDALADHNFDEATKFFDYVRTHYPFQEASKTAELRLADTDFAREDWDAARERYQNFVKAHPSNAQADYAAYRAALTYYKDAPSHFFMLPPAYEKDLTPVENALTAMRSFTHDWPDSKYLPDAKKVISGCESLLARHDMYVSDFYAKRDHLEGAAHRLEMLVKDYDQSDLVDEALFKLHDLYLKLKQPDKAKDALQRIVSRAPGSSAAKKAQKLLGS